MASQTDVSRSQNKKGDIYKDGYSKSADTLNVSFRILGECVLLAYFSHLNMASATFSVGSMFLSRGPNTSNRENPKASLSSPTLSLTTSTT